MLIKEFNLVLNKIIENAKKEGMQIYFPRIVCSPKGEKQDSEIDIFEHEFVNQKIGCSCDDYYGEIYYPLGNGHYLEVGYNM